MKERIGHYTIVGELGRGGMGVVYKAHEESLNRFVAIKVLGSHLTEDRDYVQRFMREARAAAALNHPNIVQIYFVGEDEGTPYFVMEYVTGTSVQAMIRKHGRLDPVEAASIVLQAANGLGAAHSAGIIHRDIKPANLMVNEQGLVKIADFGLALAPEAQTRLTATGMLMGTPGYLSPEQCMDQGVDHRSDIYSLGVTFFEMLAGTMPFSADSPLALLRKIVEVEAPDVRELNPDADETLRGIVARMMAKTPEERYQACGELESDLREWLTERGASARIPVIAPSGPPSGARPADEPDAASLNLTPTVLVEGGSGAGSAPPPPPEPTEVVPPVPPTGAVPPPPPAAAAPTPPPPAVEPPAATPDPGAAAPPAGRSRAIPLLALVLVLLLVGAAGAGFVAFRMGLFGGGKTSHEADASTTAPEEAAPLEEALAAGSDGSAAPDRFADVSGVEVGELRGKEPAGMETSAGELRGKEPQPGRASGGALGAMESPGRTAGASGSAGGPSAAAGAPAAAASTATTGHAAPSRPPAEGTIVLALGEPLLAGEVERYLQERLGAGGAGLVMVEDVPRVLDMLESGEEVPTNVLLSRLHGTARTLVLARVQHLGSRELNYMGRGSAATTTEETTWRGGRWETRGTYGGGNPDEAQRSRVSLVVYDLETSRTVAPRWTTTVEYTALNVEPKVEQALGKVAGTVVDVVRSME